MELRQYWQIVWRRIWIPLVLVALVGAISLLTRQAPATRYAANLHFTVIVSVQDLPNEYTYDGYYAWVSSEYLTDLLSVVVTSQSFAEAVNETLAVEGSAARLGAGSIAAQTEHRTLQLNLSWGNAEELSAIVAAISSTFMAEANRYLSEPGMPPVFITPIETAIFPVGAAPSLTQRLDIPIRLTLALFAGIGLVFLLDYLDTSVRNKQELEAMGLPVLGELPRRR